MPRTSITVTPKDTIEVNSDWGFPVGVRIGDLTIDVFASDVDRLIDALTDLRREREDIARKEAGEETEVEYFSRTGPECAGFEQGAA